MFQFISKLCEAVPSTNTNLPLHLLIFIYLIDLPVGLCIFAGLQADKACIDNVFFTSFGFGAFLPFFVLVKHIIWLFKFGFHMLMKKLWYILFLNYSNY